jgi:Fe-S oxidoreductase
MQFLIIIPRFVPRSGDYFSFPLGLAYISAALKKAGYAVECLNLNDSPEPVDAIIAKTIAKKNIDCVLTGGLSIHYNLVKHVLRATKNAAPDVITIIGGGIIGSDPEFIFEALCPTIGVLGEGDLTIVEVADALANGKALGAVNGIIYRTDKGEISRTSPREPVRDLDLLPWVDYEGLEVDKLVAPLPGG